MFGQKPERFLIRLVQLGPQSHDVLKAGIVVGFRGPWAAPGKQPLHADIQFLYRNIGQFHTVSPVAYRRAAHDEHCS